MASFASCRSVIHPSSVVAFLCVRNMRPRIFPMAGYSWFCNCLRSPLPETVSSCPAWSSRIARMSRRNGVSAVSDHVRSRAVLQLDVAVVRSHLPRRSFYLERTGFIRGHGERSPSAGVRSIAMMPHRAPACSRTQGAHITSGPIVPSACAWQNAHPPSGIGPGRGIHPAPRRMSTRRRRSS